MKYHLHTESNVPYFTSLGPGLWGSQRQKRETVEDVAKRITSRRRVDITARLENPDERYACPLFGFKATGSDKHPLGCYALQEPRCVLQKQGISQAAYSNCVVFAIANEAATLVQIERARRP